MLKVDVIDLETGHLFGSSETPDTDSLFKIVGKQLPTDQTPGQVYSVVFTSLRTADNHAVIWVKRQ